MNKLIISLFSMLLLLTTQELSAQSASARKIYERGIKAYNEERYIEALPDLRQAAMSGVSEAYRPLIDLYVDGENDGSGIGNYKEAFSWVLKALDKFLGNGSNKRELGVTCLMYYDPLCFLTGDYQETIDHGTSGFEHGTQKNTYLMNQIAASYLKLGNDTKNVAKALEWLNKAISEASQKNDNLTIHTAKAIISKIFLDYSKYNEALEYSEKAATEGKIPLAAYVYGVSLIKTNNRPDIGKKWVKAAANYDYCGIFQINCFESEIRQYWRSIMNTSF